MKRKKDKKRLTTEELSDLSNFLIKIPIIKISCECIYNMNNLCNICEKDMEEINKLYHESINDIILEYDPKINFLPLK